MPNEVTDLAERFVDLVLAHQRWSEVKALSAAQVQTLFDVVSAAGFSPQKLALGRLLGHYRDQDGSSTGKTYPINSLCPYKVIDDEGEDHYFATGWLDCAFHSVEIMRGESREKLIEMTATEIKRSVPLEPVLLTADGDLLREYPPSMRALGLTYFVTRTRDENEMGSCIGVHDFCNGWMDRTRATKTHDAISCRRCHLRVTFPSEVKTYGDLRQALAPKVTAA